LGLLGPSPPAQFFFFLDNIKTAPAVEKVILPLLCGGFVGFVVVFFMFVILRASKLASEILLAFL
jgi:hypothetical protein